MAQNILISLDESDNSMKAANYVSKIVRPEDSITLFSVLPNPTMACEISDPSLVPIFNKNRAAFCALEDQKEESLNGFLKKIKDLLVSSKANPDNIKIKIIKQKTTIAKDILQETRENQYDNIVIGRRGISGIKEFLLGSVSQKVIQFAQNTAVTVVE